MRTGLKKELNLIGVFSIAAGAMISSGLFVLPGIAFQMAGPAVVFAYALAAVLVIPSMFSKAELGTAMPKAGGSYFFIERSMGPLAGTLAGIANWLSISLKSAFALIGIGAFAALLYPDMTSWQVKLTAIFCCLVFTVLNLLSIDAVGKTQVVLVLLLLALLLLYIGKGATQVNVQHYAKFMPEGFGAVLAAAGMVFVSFGGITKIASVAEEVRNPVRDIPLGMFLAFFVVSIMYVAVVFVTVGLVPQDLLAGNLTPLSTGARFSMGSLGAFALAFAAILAFVTTANSGIASASRSPMAMSRDGLLPKLFQKVSTRRGIPYASVIATSGFMILVIAFLSLEDLVKTASTMMLVLFALDNVAVIVMRESKIQGYRPVFRSPGYPYIQLASIGIYGFLIVEMGLFPVTFTGVFGLLAAGWFVIYHGFSVKRQSALIHLVERVTSLKLVDGTLESELRSIVQERDQITEDRFDRLIEQCNILDIKEPISAREMLSSVADLLAPRFNMPREDVLKLFLRREHESSTEVGQGIAIPHIIIEGEHLFDVVPVRCKPGIQFAASKSRVHTAFVLVGSRDERNYHLRALMAIASIVQEPEFEKKWLDAEGPDDMRNILLLSGRKRGKE